MVKVWIDLVEPLKFEWSVQVPQINCVPPSLSFNAILAIILVLSQSVMFALTKSLKKKFQTVIACWFFHHQAILPEK